MIQRIQTVYLILAALLTGSLFLLPLAGFLGKEGETYLLNIFGLMAEKTPSQLIALSTLPLLVVVSLNIILLFVVIFLYNKRPIQIKLSNVAVFLQLLLTVTIYYTIWKGSAIMGGSYAIRFPFTFPLISMILIYLAIRGIVKDEQLVKSIDRIR